MSNDVATPSARVPLSAEDLLRKLRAGVKEVYEIKVRDLIIPVRMLSQEEVAAARRESKAKVIMNQGDQTDADIQFQRAILMMASTMTPNGGPFLSERLLKMMTPDEIYAIHAEYTKIVDDCNPSIEIMPPEQFEALVTALKKSLITSKDCSLRQLRAICTAFQDLIQRLDSQESPMDKSSGGQP